MNKELRTTCLEVIAVILSHPALLALLEAMEEAGFDKDVLGEVYTELKHG